MGEGVQRHMLITHVWLIYFFEPGKCDGFLSKDDEDRWSLLSWSLNSSLTGGSLQILSKVDWSREF